MAIKEDLTSNKEIVEGLQNNKVTKFCYTDKAYEDNDVDGVRTYSFDKEQNIPDLNSLETNATVITKGYRTQASSLARMLVNHIFGRVSYNLNKIVDTTSNLITSIDEALGKPNGIATLDASGRIPYSQLPESAMEYKGMWDAETNTPTLTDGEGTKGDMYVVSVSGTQTFGGKEITFLQNDQILYDGEVWNHLSAGSVRTVNSVTPDGKGNVLISSDDIEIKDSAIKTNMIADSAVTEAKIASNAVTTTKIKDANVTEAKIASNAVTEAKIASNAVTTTKIKDANVTEAKIASNAVTTTKIKDANVTEAKIASNAVTTTKIKDANVTEAKIASNAVTTTKIKDASITEAKIASNAVTTAKIASNAVTTAKIKDASITEAKILDHAVTGAKIANTTIITTNIKNEAVTEAKIADSAVTTTKIENYAVTTTKIAKGAIKGIDLFNFTSSLENRTCILESYENLGNARKSSTGYNEWSVKIEQLLSAFGLADFTVDSQSQYSNFVFTVLLQIRNDPTSTIASRSYRPSVLARVLFKFPDSVVDKQATKGYLTIQFAHYSCSWDSENDTPNVTLQSGSTLGSLKSDATLTYRKTYNENYTAFMYGMYISRTS